MAKWSMTDAAARRITERMRPEDGAPSGHWQNLVLACAEEGAGSPWSMATDWMSWALSQDDAQTRRIAGMVGWTALHELGRVRGNVRGLGLALARLFDPEGECAPPWVERP